VLAAVAVVVAGTALVILRATRQPAAPAPAARCNVTLAIDPAEAVVSIDHLPAEREELAFEAGTSHTLEATAPGRIGRKMTFTAKPALELTVRLGRILSLPSLSDPEATAGELSARPPASPATRDQIHAAFAKLDRYVKCLSVLGYGDGDTRKSAPQGLPNNGVLSVCIQATEEASALAPAMTTLQAASVSYLRAASAGETGSLGRLVTAFRAQYLAVRAGWQMEELARQEADDGTTVAWHMRRVALAAQAWFRASRGAGSAARALKDARARLDEGQQALLEAARRSPQELDGMVGAQEFLKAVDELALLAHGQAGKRLDPAAAKTALQALLAAFNALVV